MKIKSARISSVPRDFTGIVQSLLYPLNDDIGHVFALYVIKGRRNALREKVAIILNEHIDRYRQTIDSKVNIPRKFEQMVQALNDTLGEVSEDFQQFSLSDFQAVIGVMTKKQLFITGFGDLSAQYMHLTGRERYTIYDLDEHFRQNEESSWKKAFITVMDGELHPSDVFYLAIPINQRELNQMELQEIVTTLPPKGALKRIEQFVGASEAYAGICFQFHEYKDDSRKKKVNPISSIEQLGQTKEDTAQLLGESKNEFSVTIRNTFKNWMHGLHKPGERNIGAMMKQGLRLVIKIFDYLFIALMKFWRVLGPRMNLVHEKVKKMELRDKLTKKALKIKDSALGIRKASWKVHLVFIVVVILIISSVMSLRTISDQRQFEEELERFSLIEQTIIEKKDQAEARMIFRDTDSARSLLTEALTLIETLPNIRSEQGRADQLRSEIMEISADLQGIIRPDINLLTEVDDALKQIKITNSGLIALSSNAVYRYNSVNQEMSRATNSTLGNLDNLVTLPNANFAIDEQRQLARLQGSNLAPVISGTNRLNDVRSLFGYNDSLYVLTASAEQIIRMRAQGDSFEAGTPWIIARNSSLVNAVDMVIDGDVYILLPNKVLQFRSGRELSFDLVAIDPVLHNASRIETSAEMRHIYILEEGNRIVVIDKNGNFVRQYIFDDLDDIKDMAIDEDARTGYIVTDDGKVYSFTLGHLL